MSDDSTFWGRVCTAMGDDWTVGRSSTDRCGRIINGHCRIFAHIRADRWIVSGEYPSDEDGRPMRPQNWGALSHSEREPAITLSIQRSPESLAREISRRLLPQYRTILNICLRHRAERLAWLSAVELHTERYSTMTGGTIRDKVVSFAIGRTNGQYYCDETGGVAFDRLYVDKDKAESVIAALCGAKVGTGN